MDTKQPNALRLADALGRAPKWQQLQAAAKLRRQHAEIETLRSKLKTLEDLGPAGDDVQILRMGYAAARLEIESLQARIQELGQMARECSDRKVVQLESALARHVRSGKDWAMRVEALERTITTLRAHIVSLNDQVAAEKKAMRELDSANARVKELEGQLDAVGAGGVEPLRKRECLHKIAEPDHFRGATEMVQASAPVVLPAPDVFAKVSHKGAAKWDVEFTWPAGKFEEDGDHKLYTEQQVRAMLATGGQAQADARDAENASAKRGEPTHEGDDMTTNDPETLSEQDIACLRDLRKRGFAVAVFTPSEIGESDPESVEDSMIEAGWRRIEYANTEESA